MTARSRCASSRCRRHRPAARCSPVEAVGLCASDVAQLHGHKHVPGEVSPLVPGHEIVGRVHELAPDADLGVTVGQRGRCRPRCAAAARARCAPSGSPFCPQMQLYGYTQGSTSRTRPARRVRRVHGDHAQHALRAADRERRPRRSCRCSSRSPTSSTGSARADLQPGESVVIQGPGHMGLICAAYAKMLGAGTVIVTGTAATTACASKPRIASAPTT